MKVKVYGLRRGPANPSREIHVQPTWSRTQIEKAGYELLREEGAYEIGHVFFQNGWWKIIPRGWEDDKDGVPKDITVLGIEEILVELPISVGVQLGKGGQVEHIWLGPRSRLEEGEIEWCRDCGLEVGNREDRCVYAGNTGREYVIYDDGDEVVSLFDA